MLVLQGISLTLVLEGLSFILKYIFETLFKKRDPTKISCYSRNKSNMQKALCCSLALFRI